MNGEIRIVRCDNMLIIGEMQNGPTLEPTMLNPRVVMLGAPQPGHKGSPVVFQQIVASPSEITLHQRSFSFKAPDDWAQAYLQEVTGIQPATEEDLRNLRPIQGGRAN